MTECMTYHPDAPFRLQRLTGNEDPSRLIQLLAEPDYYREDVPVETVIQKLCDNQSTIIPADRYIINHHINTARQIAVEQSLALYRVHRFDAIRLTPPYEIGFPIMPTHSMLLIERLKTLNQKRIVALSVSEIDRLTPILSATIEKDGDIPYIQCRLTPTEFRIITALLQTHPHPQSSEEMKAILQTYPITQSIKRITVPSHMTNIKRAMEQLPDNTIALRCQQCRYWLEFPPGTQDQISNARQ